MERDALATAKTVMQLLQARRFADIDKLRVPAPRELVSAEALREPGQLHRTRSHGRLRAVGDTGHAEPAGLAATRAGRGPARRFRAG